MRRFINRVLPRRQIVIRTGGRLTHGNFSQGGQVLCLLGAAAFAAWTGYATINYLRHDAVVSGKNERITLYRGLLAEVAEYRERFQMLAGDMKNNHIVMLDLIERSAALQRTLNSGSGAETGESRAVRRTRSELQGRLLDAGRDLEDLAGRNFAMHDEFLNAETDLRQQLGARGEKLLDASEAASRALSLERELDHLRASRHGVFARLVESAQDTITGLERMVSLTGLEAADFLPNSISAQGGPFSPADMGDDGESAYDLAKLNLQIDHVNDLNALLSSLPLTTPLDSFSLSSSYGKRRDPFNGRWAMHYGLDMTAPFKSKVLATAPGTVTFAGWKGKYGKLVEIDHGYGVISRYGHLQKISVKKGQTVQFRDNLGLLGNTGRSTGAHLHYEISHNGKSLNPTSFISAGRHVFKVPQ
ncbi:MAG: M23 family metallopeptidase [Rhodospirillales bacterium]